MSSKALVTSLTYLVETITYTRIARKRVPYEKTIALETARFFRKQGIAYGRAIADLAALKEAEIPPAALTTALEAIVGVDIAALAKAIASCYVGGMVFSNTAYALGMTFTLKNPRAVAYQQLRGTELLAELNQTTRDDINQLIINGLEHGTSPSVIARSIKALFVSYAAKKRGTQSRAEKVARTETAKAYSAGNYGAILDATGTGLAFEKRWLTSNDDRVDPHCESNGNEGWIPMGQAHSSGAQYPPDHPNCRCAEIYQRIT